jgi:hypothetical protein
VSIDENDLLPGKFIRDLYRHLGVAARVIGDHEGELLAIDAATLVDIPHRQFGAASQLFTECRVLRGHWRDAQRPGNGDPHFSPCNTNSRLGRDGKKGHADERAPE